MKTAVEFLMEEMLSNGYITQENIERSYWLVYKAEEMDKEQKYECFLNGLKSLVTKKNFKQYYNETYKK